MPTLRYGLTRSGASGAQRILDYAQSLKRQIDDKQVKAWAKGTPEDWANESHAVAVEKVYKDVSVDGDPPKLSREYIDKSGIVIDEHLEKGGVRLAVISNRIFP